jgi:hypothetical protein
MRYWALAVLGAATALGACHRGVARAPRELGFAIGDSAAFGASIVSISGDRARAAFHVSSPAHVVFLEVAPGKSIEPLFARGSAAAFDVGTHTAPLAWPVRPDVATERLPSGVEDLSAGVRQEYDRCMDLARRRYDPPAEPPRAVVRDSTGRVISSPQPAPDRNLATMKYAESGCLSSALNAERQRRTATRRPRMGYLVMFASRTPLTAEQIDSRLNQLTIKADDTVTTIEAIAAALYVDAGGRWAGYYVPW